jgi:aspartate kinase
MLVVSKFGGTSMGDAPCMLRSADVAVHHNSCIVVVSATSGTTNQLISLGKAAESGAWDKATEIFSAIESKHQAINKALGAGPEIQARINQLLAELKSLMTGIHLLRDCSSKAMDTLMSFGERLSSELFVKAMQTALEKKAKKSTVRLLDVRTVLTTDDQFGKARPLTQKIISNCARLADCKNGSVVYVTQGFIGSTESGHTTTLGRGGSDYSAAILAEGISADVLEIWTDVPGIATTDPRVVPAAKSIAEISFTEASELATFGAKVLHPATLLPALRKNIPVFVGSSFDPNEKGTWVKMNVENQPLVRALALRKKQILVTLSTPEMLHSHGFLYRIFKLFNDHKVSVDAITTSEISVSMTLDDSTLLNKQLLKELGEIADVQLEENLCLVSIIGNNINHTPGLAKKIFESISNINVRMICLGASKHNFCFLVREDQGESAVQQLHKAFVET